MSTSLSYFLFFASTFLLLIVFFIDIFSVYLLSNKMVVHLSQVSHSSSYKTVVFLLIIIINLVFYYFITLSNLFDIFKIFTNTVQSLLGTTEYILSPNPYQTLVLTRIHRSTIQPLGWVQGPGSRGWFPTRAQRVKTPSRWSESSSAPGKCTMNWPGRGKSSTWRERWPSSDWNRCLNSSSSTMYSGPGSTSGRIG